MRPGTSLPRPPVLVPDAKLFFLSMTTQPTVSKSSPLRLLAFSAQLFSRSSVYGDSIGIFSSRASMSTPGDDNTRDGDFCKASANNDGCRIHVASMTPENV